MTIDSPTQRYEQWLAPWMPFAGHGVKVGEPLHDVKMGQNDLSSVNIAETKGAGKVRIIR